MENIPSIILWAAIICWAVYVLVIKKNSNRKAAQGGEDMGRVRQAVAQVLGGEPKVVYAHWEERESYARSVKTTYYRYAAAFQDQTLWVFPLGIDKKTRQMQVGQPVVLTPEGLGKVKVTPKEKDGEIKRLEVWLGDKKGHAIVQLYVDAENLRKNRWFPVNILQQEECAAFERFLTPLARRVAEENPEVDALIEAEAREGFGVMGAGLSIGGVIGGIFLPPFGLVLALVGLALSGVGAARGAKKKCLVISAVCTAACAAWCLFFYAVMFT